MIDVLDWECLLLVTRYRYATRLILRALELWKGRQFVIEHPVRKAHPMPIRLAQLVLTARRITGMDEQSMFPLFVANLVHGQTLL